MREEIVALDVLYGRASLYYAGLLSIGTFGMLRHFGSRSCSIRTGQDARAGSS